VAEAANPAAKRAINAALNCAPGLAREASNIRNPNDTGTPTATIRPNCGLGRKPENRIHVRFPVFTVAKRFWLTGRKQHFGAVQQIPLTGVMVQRI
jgi:hypothetical protein